MTSMPRTAAASRALKRAASPDGPSSSAHRPAVETAEPQRAQTELVVITGMSGSGKASALKALEDLGYYAVDNLPAELIPRFAELVKHSTEIDRAALVVDIREGQSMGRLPQVLQSLKKSLHTTVLYLEANDDSLIRRYSETRRPHPLRGSSETVKMALASERRRLAPIRALADLLIDTSKFNVHELRAHVQERFQREATDKNILVSCVSFGYKQGVPTDAD